MDSTEQGSFSQGIASQELSYLSMVTRENLAFHHFPTEILVKVLSFLESPHLATCRLVNRSFDQIVCDTPLLQYILQLGMGGYESGPCAASTGSNISERLTALQALEKCWREPLPQLSSKSFPLPFPPGWRDAYWMATEAVFIRHSSPRTTSPDSIYHTQLDIVQLHDAMGDGPPPVKTLRFEHVCFDTFIHPTSRLVVLINSDDDYPFGILYFMSYIDGQQDSRAQVNPIILPGNIQVSEGSIVVQDLADDLLFVAQGEDSGTDRNKRLHLYHWPSGQILNSWYSTLEVVYQDTIITSQGLLLVTGYRQHEDKKVQPFFKIYSLPQDPSPSSVRHLSTFLLPTFSEPFGRCFWSASTVTASPLSPFDFTCSPRSLMHLRINATFSLFVLLSTLVRLSRPQDTSQSAPLTFPWAEWGPGSARVISHPYNEIILCGYRAVLLDEILDFTPAHVLGANGPTPELACLDPAEITVGTETTTTSLPYCKIPFELPDVSSQSYVRSLIDSDGHPRLLQIYLRDPVRIDVVTF